MKLIQLNIWQGRLMLNALRFFEKAQPDILCLQEICSSKEGRSYFFDNIEEIQKEFNYPHLYFSPTVGWKSNGLPIEFGNAILSRSPFSKTETVFTHGSFRPDAQPSENSGYNFQCVTITDNGNPVHILNHHGCWYPGEKTGTPETMRQMNMIADYISKLDGGVIFTGDLNLLPEAPSLDRLNNELINLCMTHKVETTRNFTSFREIQVCDYIFVNDRINVEKFIAHDTVVSDHNMLELVFTA